MEDEVKINKIIALKEQAASDVERVKKLLKSNPKDKGMLNCLNQAIDTIQACNVFNHIILDGDDNVCWGLNCTYYNENDHFIKSDGSINKWCLACCQAEVNATGAKQ